LLRYLSNRLEFAEFVASAVRYTAFDINLLSRAEMRKVIQTSKAPKPSGVYSQGIVSGDFVFVAGQGSIKPEDNQLELGDIRSETRRTLKNIRAILAAAGSSLRSVVRVGVFLADLKDFDGMNEVFQEFFPENPPARTTVGCALSEIKVEIDCIARLDSTSRVRGRKNKRVR
jgi:2-iminobutanoate/2-iminopropanoate deaminase